MPLDERRRRHEELLATVQRSDIAVWRRNYLRALRDVQSVLTIS